jgi:DNA-binding NarL/FixJ family response regulator
VLLVHLLTARPVLELGERAPDRVAFQQSPATSVDDLVVDSSAEGGTSIRLEIAIRRAPKFIRSDKKTNELVAALVRADLDAVRESDPLLERRLAVAVSGRQTHAQQIAELAATARGQSTADEFVDLIRTPGKFATRGRLEHLLDMVAAALVEIDDEDVGTREHRCWSVLRRLSIMQVDLEVGHEDDWTRLVHDLKPVALDPSDDAAVALRDRLEQLSAELARNAGVVDAAALRRRLHGHVRPDAHVPPAGWTRLLALDEQARFTVARSIINGGSTPLTLPRRAIREDLGTAIAADGDLIVKGDSGAGKSALVMDAIEPSELGEDRQAIALNLRRLPTSQLELVALLSTPIDELFSQLTAPERLLVIDSAEAAAEDHGEVFSDLLRSARDAGLKVIAVAATEGAGAVTQLMTSGPREYVVLGLDDDELATAAAHVPALQRLVDNPRARELLRRPIVIDLLARADDPGLPLSEAQALDHIWHHLVRNEDRHDMGAPDAREQVMLRLAAHAVRKGDVDDLLARLDHDAVDGLRRSGLLLPASRLPWERVPTLKHDLLRAYSVARLLLAERDPAAALTAIGAPRWTLASARLACEIVLSAPDDLAQPRASRFAWLQTGFDSIASAGGGERWADVPTEALLGVPDSAELLKDAWATLFANKAQGLARLIRVLHGRHRRTGILDEIIAEPEISQLLEAGTPRNLADEAAELIRDWLRAHALHGTPAGQATRIALRDSILDQCAENERILDEQEAARQAELAARTPEEVAADEERRKKFASISGLSLSRRRRRRPEPMRHPPYQWIDDAQVEHLALLGSDLGPGGEAILRRIAEDEPHSLEHAVEPPFASHSLVTYDPELLIDLAAAYYIEDADEDEDGFGVRAALTMRASEDTGSVGSVPLRPSRTDPSCRCSEPTTVEVSRS